MPSDSPPRRSPPISRRDPQQLQAGLELLKRQEVWSHHRALKIFGPYDDLVRARILVQAPSEVGLVVFLDMEGRRAVNLNPHQNVSIDRHVNLLYLRLAARTYGWTLVREPYAGERKRVGVLDRLAQATDGDRQMRVMARCTAGGYTRSGIIDVYDFIRSTLLAYDETLVVIQPSLKKSGRIGLDRALGLLELREYSVPRPSPQEAR